MPDIPEQLRTWSQSLADSVASTDIETVISPRSASTASQNHGRWLAVAASVAFVITGIIAITSLSDRGPNRIGPATDTPGTTDGTSPASTTMEPPSTTTRPPTTGSPITLPIQSDGSFNVGSMFGDVDAGALAVTNDGRVVAAVETQLLVRGPDGEVETIDLPDGIIVSQVWVGTDEIAVTWGADRGAEVDLRTGEPVTTLTRSDDTWTRTEPTPAGPYSINASRPVNPLGIGMFVDTDTQLPVVEGAGCFEDIYFEQGRSWTIERPADCTAHVAGIAPLSTGGYLVTMRPPATVADAAYPYVLHPDGTIEALPTIDTSGRVFDIQLGPDGLTVLRVEGAIATIEHISVR